MNEFALGMGPRLFGFTKGETTYSFRLFPIGGYCAMEGEDGPAEQDDAGGDDNSDDPSGKEQTDADCVGPAAEQKPETSLIEANDAAEQSDASPDSNAVAALPVKKDDSRAFYNAKVWKRMIIVIAGAVMNILLGLIFMFITLIPKDTFVSTEMSMTHPVSFSTVTGMQPGDQIVKVNGYDVNTFTDFSFALYTLPITEVDGRDFSVYKEDCLFDVYDFARQHQDQITTNEIADALNQLLMEMQPELAAAQDQDAAYQIFCRYYDKTAAALGVEAGDYPEIEVRETRMRYRTDMTVIRNGERVELHDVDFLTTISSDEDKPQVNLDFYFSPIEKNFGTMISHTFTETVSNVRMVWGSLVGLISGKFSFNEMSGPIGIASAITNVASETLATSGFGSAVMSIVYVMMIITVNLGVINMLPFPALDGGRFLMLLIEAIFRKRVPAKAERIINGVGLVLLLGLSAVIAVKDIIKLVVGG